MLIPFTSGLVRTNHYDQECRALADRHYSRVKVGATQFAPNGHKLVLRDTEGLVVFVWMRTDLPRRDGQTGHYCQIFRNESARRSSEIILEAEEMVTDLWGHARMFTYIDPRRIRSANPGYCFKRAGWRFVGLTKVHRKLSKGGET